jgi:peptide-methionine (S)-S-oxide reductase
MDIADTFLKHCKEQKISPDVLLQFGKKALKPVTLPSSQALQEDGLESSRLKHHVLDTFLHDAADGEKEVVVFATGCFWGAEKGFWRLPGVLSTAAGYAGGGPAPASYELVCTGKTGHTEAVRVVYDPSTISFADLVRWFWQCHDPTQVDGQGNDRGSQYRSALYYTCPEQLAVAVASRHAYERALRTDGLPGGIVTEVRPLSEACFHMAEAYHQQVRCRPGPR